MLSATIVERPERFDRVDRVKQAFGQTVLTGDQRFWILGGRLVVEVSDGRRIEIPNGFTTDGASVPGWAQKLTGWKPWDDPQRWGGIIHDWLYCERGTSKAHGDTVFRAVLVSEGAGWFKRKVMYAAVVVGGGSAYKANQARGPRIYV